MANIIGIPEKTATYSAAAYEALRSGKAFDPNNMIGKDFSAFAALPESEKNRPLPDQYQLSQKQKDHVRDVAIDGEAEKIFQERLKKWGQLLRIQIKLDWINRHIELPTEKQILAVTKELYLEQVPQNVRDAAANKDTEIATFRVDGKLVFQVKLPVNLVPEQFEPLENRRPLYGENRIAAAKLKAA